MGWVYGLCEGCCLFEPEWYVSGPKKKGRGDEANFMGEKITTINVWWRPALLLRRVQRRSLLRL
jgi:hypothetical protein